MAGTGEVFNLLNHASYGDANVVEGLANCSLRVCQNQEPLNLVTRLNHNDSSCDAGIHRRQV